MFSIHTYGPFTVRTTGHRFNADSFWSVLKEANSSLAETFGIYIFTRKQGDGSLLPLYVGKTTNSYAKRLKSHFKSSTVLSRIDDLDDGENLYVFLIAVTTHKKGGSAKGTTSRSRWVDFLETALIAQCMALNPKLQNDKKTLLNGRVCVPGFLGDDPSERDSSAKALAQMLHGSIQGS